MGTRHLIAVMHDNEYKIAQYGQWDGYPSGQGVDVLSFLKNEFDKTKLINSMSNIYEPEDEWINSEYIALGETKERLESGFVSYDIAKAFSSKYPSLSRDTGSDILSIVQNSETNLPMYNKIDFAGDSLFCEYAYVIDLDKNTFEVFEGFNKSELEENERFHGFPVDGEEYKQVKHVITYNLYKLPTAEQFIMDTKREDEDE